MLLSLQENQKEIVDTVFEKLYTPMRLKSLSKDNSKYSGKYYGTIFERDSVYHQGTVWTKPIGAFIDAHYLIYQDKSVLEMQLKGLKDHFYNEEVIGSIVEIYDGDTLHECCGCFAQAWSVVEILRVIEKYQLIV
ncbi:MAG: hypothetical protein NTX05_02295 [Fusobacteria bacterium]|nr:hypothetical protein [Fusobacteriota bacterium]